MKQRWFFLIVALILGVGCVLPGISGKKPLTSAPTAASAEQSTPVASPGHAKAGSCIITAQHKVSVYTRPHTDASLAGTLAAGGSIQPVYRTDDGWYGFDPGLKQSDKVGIFRLVWVQGAGFKSTGACNTLPLAPPLPSNVCFVFARQAVTVRSSPDSNASALGKLQPEEYAAAQAQGPEGWVKVNLDSGQNSLSGIGWLLGSEVGLDGPCQALPYEESATVPTVAPTLTSHPAPQPTPTTAVGVVPTLGPEQRIMFAPGAIRWSRVLSDGENAFVFRASQGQSAIIALTGSNSGVSLALTDPSGKPLQTFQDGYSEWMGMLPSTGDYHIGLAIPQGVSGLKLEVTIYPPLTSPQRVVNSDAGYSLMYDKTVFQPGEAVLPSPTSEGAFLSIVVVSPKFKNTNLGGASITLDDAPPDDPDHCLNTPPYNTHPPSKGNKVVRINGVQYRRFVDSEGAAGSFYYSDAFRAAVRGRCLTVRFDVQEYDIGALDDSVSEYDSQALWDELWRVLLTLRWRP